MISPALMLSWMWGSKREPFPEYQSPNKFNKWLEVNNEANELMNKLVDTFDDTQRKLFVEYRNKVLEAAREKPWQNVKEIK